MKKRRWRRMQRYMRWYQEEILHMPPQFLWTKVTSEAIIYPWMSTVLYSWYAVNYFLGDDFNLFRYLEFEYFEISISLNLVHFWVMNNLNELPWNVDYTYKWFEIHYTISLEYILQLIEKNIFHLNSCNVELHCWV